MTKDHLQLLTFRFYGDRHAPCHRWTLEDVAPKC